MIPAGIKVVRGRAVQLDPPEAAGLAARGGGRAEAAAGRSGGSCRALARTTWMPWDLPGGRTQRRLLAAGAVVFAAAERNCLCGDLVGCFP